MSEITKAEFIRIILLAIIVFSALMATDKIFFSAAEFPVTAVDNELNTESDKRADENENINVNDKKDGNEDENNGYTDNTVKEEPEKRSEILIKALNSIIESAKNEVDYKPDDKRKYSGYFDKAPDEWSAEFLSWCVASAESQMNIQLAGAFFPWTDNVAMCLLWFAVKGGIYEPNDYIPIGGDYVFFDGDGNGTADSVGLIVYRKDISVIGTDGETRTENFIDVIMGDGRKSGTVEENEIELSSKEIVYFGKIIG